MEVDCGYTENYLRKKNRMTNNCGIACDCCLLGCQTSRIGERSCTHLELNNPDIAIEIVQKWSDEHPQETRAEHFYKMFPNGKFDGRFLSMCVKNLNEKFADCEKYSGCKECWNDIYKEGDF